MTVDLHEHDITKSLAYEAFPKLVGAIRRHNVLMAAKELYECEGLTKSEYRTILCELLKAEGIKT